ncbi:MAG: hypothetical protein KC636_14160 [Myxococcales bacterium]|nr:hypothetical protein [Myxococcales bacterium]
MRALLLHQAGQDRDQQLRGRIVMEKSSPSGPPRDREPSRTLERLEAKLARKERATLKTRSIRVRRPRPPLPRALLFANMPSGRRTLA